MADDGIEDDGPAADIDPNVLELFDEFENYDENDEHGPPEERPEFDESDH